MKKQLDTEHGKRDKDRKGNRNERSQVKCTQKQNRTEKQSNSRWIERPRKKIDMKTKIETGRGKEKTYILSRFKIKRVNREREN